MLACPDCSTRLDRQGVEHGVVYACPKCGGRAMGLGLLHKSDIPDSFMHDLWKKAIAGDACHTRECPHCGQLMAEVTNNLAEGVLVLDVCTSCQSVWFDPKEHEILPHNSSTHPESKLSAEGKIILAKAVVMGMGEGPQEEQASAPPDHLWQQAVTFLGLPAVETDDEITVRPYFIWGLSALCVLIYFLVRSNLEAVELIWGFMPELWTRHNGATFITSFFLHANWLHLAFNIYLLLVFGDHLEGLLGRWRLMMLIFGSHLAGLVAHLMFLPHSTEPLIGASAGIAGILAYFTISFPRARVALMWGGMRWRAHWVRLPVLFYLAIFVLGEMTPSFLHLGMSSKVPNLAHFGGLMVGVCAAIWAKTNGKMEPRRI